MEDKRLRPYGPLKGLNINRYKLDLMVFSGAGRQVNNADQIRGVARDIPKSLTGGNGSESSSRKASPRIVYHLSSLAYFGQSLPL